MNTEATNTVQSNTAASLNRRDSNEVAAHLQSAQAKTEATASKNHFVEAGRDGFEAINQAGRSAGNKVTSLFNRGVQSGQQGLDSAGNAISSGIDNTEAAAKTSWSRLKADCSNAGHAGATGTSYARSTPLHPSIAERVGGALRTPFASVSYIANHATYNPVHATREANTARPGVAATVAGAAASIWAASCIGAGFAPKYLGWLVKPAPYTAGVAALPNLAAYAFYGSVAVIAGAALVRVGVAVYDKFQEGRSVPANNIN